MALDTNIRGISGLQADVDANLNLTVRTPTVLSQAGFCALAGRVDDGTIVAGGRTNRIYVTEGNSLKAAIGTLLWDDTFNTTAQNTAKYRVQTTTQTVTFASGFCVLNGSSITSINTNCAIQTYKTFPLFAKSEIRANVSAMITVAPQANAVTEFGLFSAVLPGAAIPTDGAFFRYNNAGALVGVINYNGTETTTATITTPSLNVNHDYLIVCQTNTVTFWIDDVMVAVLSLAVAANTQGQPFMSGSQPWTARHYIGGSAPTSAMQLKISDVFITYLGPDLNRIWPHTKAAFGHMGYQGQNGGTMGSTANYANSANPVAAVPTNTTAALGTGLGGQFWETASLAVNTDGIISSFQNPVGSATQTPRNLIITGVKISSFIQTVIAGGPFVCNWSLAYGHTAVSLATAEAANAKAPRRIALGNQLVTAAQAVSTLVAADQGNSILVTFQNPIVVAPGEFVACVKKHVGTVGTTGTIGHLITFDSYFE